ncbi:MAG TPA: NAD(P)/FAD-dependent oxidoreductase [Mucilaginibacter sp.]
MPAQKTDYDAVVVGSGPNGLAAAIHLQQNGLSVLLIEGKPTIGGGLRTTGLTLPGYMHDICSAVHPMAVGSSFFETLPLAEHGLEYIYPEIDAAHPLDNGDAGILVRSVSKTADLLGNDASAYKSLIMPVVKDWPSIAPDILGPLHYPKHPLAMARFGLPALTSAARLVKRFETTKARALIGGMSAHSIRPLSGLATSAIALVLMANGHLKGWPIPRGGSVQIANSLASYFKSLGGKIETNIWVTSLQQLPSSRAVLFDVTPRQLLEIAGHKFSAFYKWQLQRYRYGMGVFKIDWALDAPIPFKNEDCRKAGTIHIGNTFEEIASGEQQIWEGAHPETPYVLLAQPSILDATRAPAGKHVAWAYCHVPNGSEKDMTAIIENQVERFAPGFKAIILARHTLNSMQMQDYNPNYIGGDINGGVLDLAQLFTRPALRWSPYKTSAKGLYICSSSTPPGGGVHGMCGYNAAKRVLKDLNR